MTTVHDVAELAFMRDHLATIRQHFAVVKEAYRIAEEQFKVKNGNLIAEVEQIRQAMDNAEEELRNAAIAHYDETGEKRPVPGVEVKVRKALTYHHAEATAWAHMHKMCLMLDKKAFETVAKTGMVDCALVFEEPYATLAKELPQT